MAGKGSVMRAVKRGARAEAPVFSFDPGTTATDPGNVVWVNTTGFAMRVRAIKTYVSLVEGGAQTAAIYKSASGTAATAAAGTLLTSGATSIDLNGGVDTTTADTLTTTATDLVIPPDAVIFFITSSDIGTAVGCVSVDLVPA